MKTTWWGIVLILLCTICTSFAAISNKQGAINFSLTIEGTMLNWFLILGLFLLACATVLLMFALKGGDVTVIYPIISTSYIWVAILSFYLFNEAFTYFKLFGIISIVAGVIVLNIADKLMYGVKA
jgi:multidrug transporter EmrE-like cation transporter